MIQIFQSCIFLNHNHNNKRKIQILSQKKQSILHFDQKESVYTLFWFQKEFIQTLFWWKESIQESTYFLRDQKESEPKLIHIDFEFILS